MAQPSSTFVTGPPGSGKTTLARKIARAIPCPMVSRDEIKEGIVSTAGGEAPVWGGPVSQETHEAFFGVLRVLLGAGATVVAEAALRGDYWTTDFETLIELGSLRIVHCTIESALVRERVARRARDDAGTRASRPDREILAALEDGTMTLDEFELITKMGPALRVDTTDGYSPSLPEIVTFVSQS